MNLEAAVPAVFFVAMAVIAMVTARALGQGAVNPISVYATVWSTVSMLAVLSLTDFRPMRFATWSLVFASSAALVLGSVHAWLFLTISSRRRALGRTSTPVVYSERSVNAAFLVGLAALVAYVGIQFLRPSVFAVFQSVGGLKGILNGSGLEYRYAYVALSLQQAETGFEGGGLGVAVIGYLLFVPAMLVVLLSGHFALSKRWWMVAVPMAVIACYSALSLERATFIHALLLCLLSCYYHAVVQNSRKRGKQRRKAIDRLRMGATVLVVIAVAIYVPLKVRDPSLTILGTLDSVLEYVSAPLGALNLYVIQHPSIIPAKVALGTNSFWGPASVLLRLGVPLHLPPNWMEFVLYQARGQRTSNVYTWLLYFLLDFGWAGVIAIPYALGLGATSLHFFVVVRGRRDLIAPLCILMTQLVMSFFAFSLLRDLRYWFLMLLAPVVIRSAIAQNTRVVGGHAPPATPATS